jgi:hypothetical protein
MTTLDAIASATRDAVGSLASRNPELYCLLEKLIQLGRVAVVGGAPRDWSLGRVPRDIDIVVDVAPHLLRQQLVGLTATATGMGGNRLRVGETCVDVWALSSTWAFVATCDPFPIAMESLPRTGFLNLDSIAVELHSWRVHEHGLLAGLRDRVVDVNFEPNPRPIVCVARAIAMAHRYDLCVSPNVEHYVRRWVRNSGDWQAVRSAHLQRYHESLTLEIVRAVLPSDGYPEWPNGDLPRHRAALSRQPAEAGCWSAAVRDAQPRGPHRR